VPVISVSLGYADSGCPDAEDILPVITLESTLSTGRFPEPGPLLLKRKIPTGEE